MEWLPGDQDVWLVELEYLVKKAITFDPTVVSRSNFYWGFREAVFIGVVFECLLGDEVNWSAELEYRFKRAITYDPSIGSRLNFYKGF